MEPENDQDGGRFQVLNTPELLDNICSFQSTKDLKQARQVSGFWREAANRVLRRRLYALERVRINVDENLPLVFRLFLRDMEPCRRSLVSHHIPPPPIPSTLDKTEIHIGLPYDNQSENFTRTVPEDYAITFKTLLTFDWAARIQRLNIATQVLSVQEWNFAGVYLLSCLTSLRHLRIMELDSRSESCPEWRSDIPVVENTSLVVSNLEDLFIGYSHDPEEFVSEERLLDLGFLKNCPKLKALRLVLLWNKSTMFSFSIECRIDRNVSLPSNKRVNCSVKLTGNFAPNDRRIVEMNSHLTALEPASLEFDGEVTDYLVDVPLEATSNLDSLRLDVRFGTSAEWIISSLSKLEALGGISKLRLTHVPNMLGQSTQFPSRLDELASALIAENHKSSLSSVVNLTLDDLSGDCLCRTQKRGTEGRFFGFFNLWPTPLGRMTVQMWEQATSYMPNVQVLNVTEECECFIEHAHRFKKLRHLVVRLRNGSRSSARLFKEQVRGLQELRTLTVGFEGDQEDLNSDVEKLQRLVEVMTLAPNLQVVQVYYPILDNERVPNFEIMLRRNIPELSRFRLNVRRSKREDADYYPIDLELLDAVLQ